MFRLKNISDEEREAFKKLFLQGLTYPEIVENLGRAVTTWQNLRKKMNLPHRKRGSGEHIKPSQNPGLDPPLKQTLLWKSINTRKWGKNNSIN